MIISLITFQASAQRKVTPVNNPQIATQAVNEFKNDTAYEHKMLRNSPTTIHYHDEKGNTIFRDTVSGKTDTIFVIVHKPMDYPLLHAVSVGVDIWNPLMRLFGQHYGLIDFSAQLSLHNRYKPIFETGIGIARNTPPDNNFTYRSPMSMYWRVGMDYNFLYNSNPEYQFFIGIRYGCSKFSFTVDDISIGSEYWGETAHPQIPTQRPFVGWAEFAMGLKVQLWGPISAGWTFRYHRILHEGECQYGQPWYVPGYGTRGSAISGSFTISYTFNLNKKPLVEVLTNEGSDSLEAEP